MRHVNTNAFNKSRNSKYIASAFVCTSLFFLELILRLDMEDITWGIGLLYALLFNISIGLCASFVISFTHGKFRRFLIGAVLLFFTLVYASQLVYYNVFQTFYSMYSAAKGGQVIQFYKDILYTIGFNVHWLVLMFVPFFTFMFFSKSRLVDFRHTGRDRILILISAGIAFACAIIPINIGNRDANSPYDLYYRSSYPIYSVMNLGLLTTMRIDIQRTVIGFDGNLPDIDLTPTPAISEAITPTAEVSPDSSPTPAPVYNILDIDFDKLISETNNETLKTMHEYFNSITPTAQNEYTGIFEGYNLILITAESFSQYAINEEVTPTLYMMSQQGFVFKDFYNPLWNVSTSDGEYVATTGLIPKNGVWSLLESADNLMPFAMGNQFRKLGVETYAYHNHYFDYYGRDLSHPNLGYIYKGLGNGLKVTEMWPESDLQMMQVSMPDYIEHERFHAYYMTVSGHLSYNFFGNQMAVKNKSFVENLPLVERAKAYMATQIEFDRAMEYLLEQLDKAGVAEKTLIVISADHYPYGLKKDEIDNLAGHDVESNFELYSSSLLMYVKGMDPVVIDRPVSSMDIIPTISNLLGIDYDSRLLMGIDVFSDTQPLVIFNNKSFISDKGRYNALTKIFTPVDGAQVSETYVTDMLAKIEKKFYFSAKILDEDYYRVLFE